MTPARPPLTYPSPKYGPTPDYGTCELDDRHAARATCPDCGGHYCLGHAEHADHAARQAVAGRGGARGPFRMSGTGVFDTFLRPADGNEQVSFRVGAFGQAKGPTAIGTARRPNPAARARIAAVDSSWR